MTDHEHHHIHDLPRWDKWLFGAALAVLAILSVVRPDTAGITIAIGALYAEVRHLRIVLSRKKHNE